jgi:uncharacterized protein YjbI with pentapeptide repeats
MANPEHLELLKAGAEVWNRWRNDNPRLRPELNGADLSGIALSNANLSWASLTGANLGRTTFSKADLHLATLREADLRSADLSGVDLSGANLHLANLANAQLIEANLKGADLSGANLRGTGLGGASLGGANLEGADLSEANLAGASLSGASLSGASLNQTNLSKTILHFTNFTGAHLTAPRFSEASFYHAVLADADLSTVVDLETVRHEGPSSIGLDTFFRSKGKIPESFLRGCGVPEELIRHFPSSSVQLIKFYSCFISYSHEDKAFARLLHDRLQGQGIRCWLDDHQLLPGQDIYYEIDRGIRLWDKVLLCASKSSLTSWWVDGEINSTFQKEAQIMKKRRKRVLKLIPLNLDGFLFSDDYQSGKKAEITSRVAADFIGWEKEPALFDRELEKVIRALRTDEGGREKPPPARL